MKTKLNSKRSHGLAVVDQPPNAHEGIALLLESTAKTFSPEMRSDSWRHNAAAVLCGFLPMCHIHVGGHHIAIHAQGPMPIGAIETGPCMGRIVETKGGLPV